MSRITRSASQALMSLAIALSVVTLASAEAPPTRYDYEFCVGIAGNPRVEVFSPVFHRGATDGVSAGGNSSFVNVVGKKIRTGVREAGCSYFPTAAEAEAKRREIMDEIIKNLGPQAVVVIDWKPQGGPAPQPKPAAPATPATPQAPKPVTSSATPKPSPPAASAAPKGLFVVCNGIDLLAGKLFFNPPLEVTGGDADVWSASYAKYLLTNYKYDRNIACTKLPTLAEAQSYYKETSDARRSTSDLNGKSVPLIVTGWRYP